MSSNININSSLLLYNGMSILYACISAGEYDAPGFLNFSNNLEIFIKSGLAGHLKLLDLCTMCYNYYSCLLSDIMSDTDIIFVLKTLALLILY